MDCESDLLLSLSLSFSLSLSLAESKSERVDYFSLTTPPADHARDPAHCHNACTPSHLDTWYRWCAHGVEHESVTLLGKNNLRSFEVFLLAPCLALQSHTIGTVSACSIHIINT
jgi:hypothetical protein